jgi:hypothetical protein
MNTALLEHLKGERLWLRNRLSMISQMIIEMERGGVQPTQPKSTFEEELRDMVVPRS